MINQIEKIIIYLYPLIISLGIIGNAFSFLIFSRKQFKKTIFQVYFRLVSISNTLAVIIPVNYFLMYQFNYDISKLSSFTCKLMDYLIYTSCPISSYILAYASIDRMLHMVSPFKYQFRNKIKFQLFICILVIFITMIYYVPILVFRKLEPIIGINQSDEIKQYVCVYTDGGFIYWMDLFYSTIIPFVIMFISTSITVFVLFKSKKKTNGINSRDIKYAITSISLNICFFVFVFPLTVFLLLSLYLNIDEKVYELTFIILLCIYSINYANMFYVNMFTNSIFRNEFLKMLIKNLRKIGVNLNVKVKSSTISTIN